MSAPLSRGRIHPAKERRDVCATPGFSTLRPTVGTGVGSLSKAAIPEKYVAATLGHSGDDNSPSPHPYRRRELYNSR
jgi:hypothetical protein